MSSTGWDASVLHNVARWGKRATEAPEFIHGERHKTLQPIFLNGFLIQSILVWPQHWPGYYD